MRSLCYDRICYGRALKCLFVRYTSVKHVETYRCHAPADVWGEGDLPPGWREISDSSEVYFWHVPTGTTQYHRPVASSNLRISPNNEPDAERDPQLEMQESLKPPNEVRATDLTHLDTSDIHTHTLETDGTLLLRTDVMHLSVLGFSRVTSLSLPLFLSHSAPAV